MSKPGMVTLVATAAWTGSGWLAVICEPYIRAVWRGAVYKDWHAAADAAEKELASSRMGLTW